MTQQQLGEAIGIKLKSPQTTVYNYEKGHRTPSLEVCRLIVLALNKAGANCTLDAVFPVNLSRSA